MSLLTIYNYNLFINLKFNSMKKKVYLSIMAVVLAFTFTTGYVSAQTVNTAMTAHADTFSVTFDVTPSHAPMNGGVGLSKGEIGSWGEMSTILGFAPDGNIRARNGGSYMNLEILPYEAGKVYHIVMTVDVPNNTYSATITPDGGTEVVMAYEFGFRAAADTINNYFSHNDSLIAWGGVHDATLDITNFVIEDNPIEIEYGITIPASDGYTTSIPIAPQTARFTAEFSAIPSHDSMNAGLGMSKDTAMAWGDLSAIVRFGTTGLIDVRNGGTYEAMAEYKYYKDRTYDFSVDVDVLSNTYSVTVTGDDHVPVLLAENYGFRAAADTLNFRVLKVVTDPSWGGKPDSYIDVSNFKISFTPATTKVYSADSLPVIDGDISDGYWDNIEQHDMKMSISKPVVDPADASAFWKAAWTQDTLYVMVDVNDATLWDTTGGQTPTWNTDGVHFYWGLLNDRNGEGGSADNSKVFGQFYYPTGSGGFINEWVIPNFSLVKKEDGSGYIYEAAMPWTGIDRNGVLVDADSIMAGKKFLFDVDMVDNDSDGWWSELYWSSDMNCYVNMDHAGEVELVVTVNKTELQSVVDSSTAVVNSAVVGWDTGEYPQKSVDTANAAIAVAQGVLGSSESQPEIDQATTDLRTSMAGFVPNAYSYVELSTVIDSSKAVVDTVTIGDADGEYSQEKVDAANAAIASADSVLGNAASQEEVDQATAGLRAAIAAFTPNGSTGVERLNANDFEVYPNPVVNKVTVANIKNGKTIKVLSVTGAIMKTEQVNNRSLVTIDLSRYSNGTYILKIETEEGVASRLIIKE